MNRRVNSRSHTLPAILLLIVTLLWVQSAGAIHAVDHWFHAADESCAVYFAAERLGHGVVDMPLCPVLPVCRQCAAALPRQTFIPVSPLPFRARAPPIHI